MIIKRRLTIERSIFPIMGYLNGNPTFLGTGCFLDVNKRLLTAYHVIKGYDEIGIMNLNGVPKYFPAKIYRKDELLDLVALDVEEFTPGYYFVLQEDDEYPINQFVICCEYGTTITKGQTIEFSYATRIGNITRMFANLDILKKAGENALEISFPALQGSSGAPILLKDSMKIIGIMMKNVQYDLLPVQIERITDKDGKLIEEIKYMMPQGIAINVKHVRKFIGE